MKDDDDDGKERKDYDDEEEEEEDDDGDDDSGRKKNDDLPNHRHPRLHPPHLGCQGKSVEDIACQSLCLSKSLLGP